MKVAMGTGQEVAGSSDKEHSGSTGLAGQEHSGSTGPAGPRTRKPTKPVRRTRSDHPGVVLSKRTWKRPDGSRATAWRMRFVDPDDGEPRWETCEATSKEGARAEAKRRAATLTRRTFRLADGAQRQTGRSLKGALDDYVAGVKAQKRERTHEHYKPAVERFAAWAEREGIYSVDHLRPEHVHRYCQDLAEARRRAPVKGKGEGRGKRQEQGKRISPASVNSYMRPVRAALRALRKAGQLPHVTPEDIGNNLERVREPKRSKPILNQADVRRLLDAALAHDGARFKLTRDEHDGARPAGSTPRYADVASFVAFVALSGCRVSEALSVDWRGVDLDAADDQGAPVGTVTMRAEDVKTDEERDIGLEVSPGLRRILKALRDRTGGTGRVFADLNEDILRAAARRLVKTYQAPRFNWQMLRRTCGSFLVCSPGIFGGSAVYLAAKQLGHRVEVAEKHYLNTIRGIPRDLHTLDDVLGIGEQLNRIERNAPGLTHDA